jgi:hypothetical protein
MEPRTERGDQQVRGTRYVRAGLAVLVVAILAILIPVLATAAEPHVVWLFSTSWGAVGVVLGVTLIRVGHRAPDGRSDLAAERFSRYFSATGRDVPCERARPLTA